MSTPLTNQFVILVETLYFITTDHYKLANSKKNSSSPAKGVTYEKNNMDDRITGLFVFYSGGDGSAILGSRRAGHGGRPHISY
jgi:hypothetical protein